MKISNREVKYHSMAVIKPALGYEAGFSTEEWKPHDF